MVVCEQGQCYASAGYVVTQLQQFKTALNFSISLSDLLWDLVFHCRDTSLLDQDIFLPSSTFRSKDL